MSASKSDEVIVGIADAADLREQPYRLRQRAGWVDLLKGVWFVVALAARPWLAPELVDRKHAKWPTLTAAVVLVYMACASLRHVCFAGSGDAMFPVMLLIYGLVPLKYVPRYGLANMGVSIFIDTLVSLVYLSHVVLLPESHPGSMPRIDVFDVEVLLTGLNGLALLCGAKGPKNTDRRRIR